MRGVCIWRFDCIICQMYIYLWNTNYYVNVYLFGAYSKSKEHTVPFFLKLNCLPLPSLFFRDCSYLLYDINRQTYSISLLKQVRFITTEQDLSLATRFMLSSLEPVTCMPFSRESVPKFGTLFLIQLKYLNVCPFVKE